MTDPLDALVAAEKAASAPPSPEVVERIWSQVAVLPPPVAGGGGATGTAGTTSAAGAAKVGTALSVKLAVAALVAGAVGGAAAWQLRDPPGVAPRVVSAAEVAASAPVPVAPVAPVVEPVAEAQPAAADPSARREAVRAPARRDEPTAAPSVAVAPPPELREAPAAAADQALEGLLAIRTALARRDAAEARALLEAHRREYPATTFDEERDAAQLQLLLLEGRPAEARTSAEAFLARYPKSLYRPAAEAVVAE